MSVDLSNSVIKVYRDVNDKYFTYLTGNIYNIEKKQTEGKFYSKRKIKFADNQEVKNKAKIKILDGFATPFKFKVKAEDKGMKYISGEMYYIRSFELLEDGVDEKQKILRYPQKQKPQEQKVPEKKDKNAEKLNSFSFNEYSSVTPF